MFSNFAINRVIKKHRNIARQSKDHNMCVIAGILENQAQFTFSGKNLIIIENFVSELCELFRKQSASDKKIVDATDVDICLISATVQAIRCKNVDMSFFELDTINRVKVLCNLQLLPESFLELLVE